MGRKGREEKERNGKKWKGMESRGGNWKEREEKGQGRKRGEGEIGKRM